MKAFTLNNKKLLLVVTFLCSNILGFSQTLDFYNLQFPETGTQIQGGTYDVYAQVYEPGVTDLSNTAPGFGISAWIGISSTNTNPDTWTNWVPATYNLDVGNNDEFVANIGPYIPYTGIYYYASRFQYNTEPYVYGGILADGTAGDEWDGITYISGVLTITCSSTTTWDGINWTPITGPDATTAVVLNANYNTSTDGGSFDACSLTVNAGFNLNIQGTDYVSVVNDIAIDGSIIVATEASLVQINDLASVTLNGAGNGRLDKTTNTIDAGYEYTYWSSPMVNETIGNVLTFVPVNRIYKYDAANFEDADNNGFDDNADDWAIVPQTDPMTPGKGYAAFPRPATFAYPETQTFNFNGQFNNGVIEPAITVSTGPNPLNWNFLGNPYPSPINADLFLGDPLNSSILNGTIYLWTHNSPPDDINPGNENLNFSVDDYASYNLTGGVGTAAVTGGATPTGIIATAQGFFIEANSAGLATFNNSMRVNTGNTNFYKTSDRIWLSFKNDYGAYGQILIGFNENATNGYDRLYDGKKLDAGSYVSFFSFIDDEKYAIQSREALTEEEVIPIGIMTSIDTELEYSISIDKLEGILETSEIYLTDYLLNVEHNLNKSEYKFNVISGEYRDRFAISFKTELIDTSVENELIVKDNLANGLELSTTHQSNISNLQMYDMLGRLLYNIDFKEETKSVSIDSKSLNNSIYIIKATLADNKVLTKKILH